MCRQIILRGSLRPGHYQNRHPSMLIADSMRASRARATPATASSHARILGLDNISPGLSTGKGCIGGMRSYLQDLVTYLPQVIPGATVKLFTPDWSPPFDLPGNSPIEAVPFARTIRGPPVKPALRGIGRPRLENCLADRRAVTNPA